jgi:hypothetical protein
MLNLSQLPGLLLYGLAGAALASIQDRLMLIYPLWEYRDTGLIDSHLEISFLISMSAAPIFAMRFAQGLKPGGRLPWGRVTRYTVVSMLPELVAVRSGHIHYHNWWNIGWSCLAYLPIWTVIWLIHRWVTLSRPPSAPIEQEQTAPGS